MLNRRQRQMCIRDRDPVAPPERMQAGLEERLVHVDVAEACDKPLVQEQRRPGALPDQTEGPARSAGIARERNQAGAIPIRSSRTRSHAMNGIASNTIHAFPTIWPQR